MTVNWYYYFAQNRFCISRKHLQIPEHIENKWCPANLGWWLLPKLMGNLLQCSFLFGVGLSSYKQWLFDLGTGWLCPLNMKLGETTFDQLYFGSTLCIPWRGKCWFLILVFRLPTVSFFYRGHSYLPQPEKKKNRVCIQGRWHFKKKNGTIVEIGRQTVNQPEASSSDIMLPSLRFILCRGVCRSLQVMALAPAYTSMLSFPLEMQHNPLGSFSDLNMKSSARSV